MDNSIIKLAERNDCTGCMACGDVCPKGCISFVEESDGFWYPRINSNLCIRCKSCQKVCPIVSPYQENVAIIPRAYAAWLDDVKIRKTSASGGAFYALASQIIKEGGYVAGAVFDGYKVKHILTNSLADLERIQGTKYFQSQPAGIYQSIRLLLRDGIKVLFSGTSCQVAGLLNIVGDERKNLITVDLICFGVPSSLIIGVEERMRRKKIKRIIKNRDKEHNGGWRNVYYMTCEWEDGTITVSSPNQSFMLGSFCSGKVMRMSCYHCPFKKISRQSDLTIGDYHCVNAFDEEKTDGISLVYVHSDKGAQLLLDNTAITVHERDIQESLPFKRTIYYNDSVYEKCAARRFMTPLLHKSPLWFLNIIYRSIVKSKNPLIWPFTAIDVFYFWLNNRKAKKEKDRIIKLIQ